MSLFLLRDVRYSVFAFPVFIREVDCLRASKVEVILHQWEISPFCTKVRLILDYKEVAYNTINYNGLRSLKIRNINPAGKLPVLEVNGNLIPDSREIAHYLEKTYPKNPIYPLERSARAHAELLADWADSSLYFHEIYQRAMYAESSKLLTRLICAGRPTFEQYLVGPAVQRVFKSALYHQGTGRESRNKVESRFITLMESLDVILSENVWVAGGEISIADFAVAGQLLEVLRTSQLTNHLLSMPFLFSWLKRFKEFEVIAMHRDIL